MEVITGLQDRDKRQLTVGVLAAALFARSTDKTLEQCIDEAIPLATRILSLRGDSEPLDQK
jgi:hypothetical protein